MAEDAFAFHRLVHLGLGGEVFAVLRDEGEHDGQRAAMGGADQGLQLHPHDARFVEAHADGAPAQGGVRLVIGLHVGQHLVGADVERAKDHALALGGIEDAGIERREFRAFRHLVADQKLQFGAEQAHAFGA